MAQPDRAAVQQTQELAQVRDTLRQDQGILPRLRRARLSQTLDTLCPRNLTDALEQLNGFPIPDDAASEAEVVKEIFYIMEMEKALLHYQLGKLKRRSSGNANFVDAQKIYLTMEKEYPKRSIVQYRLARVESEIDGPEEALRRALKYIESQSDFDAPEDHWVQSSFRRLAGFWAAQLGGFGHEAGAELTTEQLDYRLQAVSLSKAAVDTPVSTDASPNEAPHETPRRAAA